jgi:hypothetical protein
MKRKGLVALAALVIAGLIGCSGSSDATKVPAKGMEVPQGLPGGGAPPPGVK